MSVADRWHKSRPKPGEPKCSCRPAKVPTVEHGQGKRWQVRWRDETGKEQKLNFENKPAAERKDAEIKASLDRGDYVDPKAGKVTLGSYGRQWRATLSGLDPVTLEQLDSRLAKWVYGKSISDQAMGVLAKRPSIVRAWIKDMEAELEPSTIKGIVKWVSSIFNAAVDDGVVARNPVLVKSVRRPVVVPTKAVPWTLDQVEAMAGAVLDRYGAMVYLGSGCAHRQGELFGVAVDDVDFLGREVHVMRQVRIVGRELVFAPPKRGKTRTAPLPDSIGLQLSEHIRRFPPVEVTLPWVKPGGRPHTARLLFVTEDGGALRRNTFNRAWKASLGRAGIPDARENGCHVLRHTAASAWLAAGVDIRTVAEYLGHDDPGFTLRTYTHLMPNAADRARKAMDLFFQRVADVSSALDAPSG